MVVAEVSSFQLEYTRSFRPDVSCWLNFAPDHLDWHPNVEHYLRAKAKIWAHQAPGSVAVVNADDPVVLSRAATVPAGVRVVTFGATGTWAVGADTVGGPGGVVLKATDLPRAFPHDLANTAAALAVAMAAGADAQACRRAARTTPAPPHRVQLVGEQGGVGWYDDSKATTPAAVLAAVSAFSSVVLIAGGRNKGLDLSALAAAAPPVRAVVAIGEAAPEVAAAFGALVPVGRATSMGEAVEMAGRAGGTGGRRGAVARVRQFRLVLVICPTGRAFRRPGASEIDRRQAPVARRSTTTPPPSARQPPSASQGRSATYDDNDDDIRPFRHDDGRPLGPPVGLPVDGRRGGRRCAWSAWSWSCRHHRWRACAASARHGGISNARACTWWRGGGLFRRPGHEDLVLAANGPAHHVRGRGRPGRRAGRRSQRRRRIAVVGERLVPVPAFGTGQAGVGALRRRRPGPPGGKGTWLYRTVPVLVVMPPSSCS